MVMRNKKGLSATEAYMVLLAIGFLLVGIYALFALLNAYSLENQYEGIGFRQGAVISTYEEMDGFLLYTNQVLKEVISKATVEYYRLGTHVREQECESLSSYPGWVSPNNNCVIDNHYEDTGLQDLMQRTLSQVWQHPVFVQVPRYEFSFSREDAVLVTQASARDSIFVPLIGVKGEAASQARVLRSETSRTISQEFVKDTRLPASINELSFSNAREEEIRRVLIIPSNTSTSTRAYEGLVNNEQSVHYLISEAPYNSITQHLLEVSGAVCEGCEGAIVIMLTYPLPVSVGAGCPASHSEQIDNLCWQSYNERQLEVLSQLVKDVLERNELNEQNIDLDHMNKVFDKDGFLTLVREAEVPEQETFGAFHWPTTSTQVESCYGDRMLANRELPDTHDGVDIAAATGTPVFAVGAGEVFSVCYEWVSECACSVANDEACRARCDGRCGNYGNNLVIKHAEDLYTRYSHLETISVRKGSVVKKEQPIGTVGNTGYSFGSHLDFKVYTDEAKINQRDAGANPFCYFSQQQLLQTKATETANSCRDLNQYLPNNQINTAWHAQECEGVNIHLEQQGCFSDIIDVAISDNDKRKVETTQNRIKSSGLEEVILRASNEHDVPAALIKAVITQESTGDVNARSPTGALGIMQFVVNTAGDYNLRTTQCCPDAVNSARTCHTYTTPSCNINNDDRLKPALAIDAGAQHLKALLNFGAFRNHEDRLWLAVQSYNSGQGTISNLMESCTNRPLRPCIQEALAQDNRYDEHFADRILGYMVAFGGDIDDVTGDVSCYGITGKNLGGLEFDPSLRTKTFDGLYAINALTSWVKSFVENTNNNLHTVSEQELSVSGWEVNYGFCEDEQNDLHNLVVQIQECADNNQEMCECSLRVDDDESFVVVFHDNGLIEKQQEISGSPVVVSTITGPVISRVDGELVPEVRVRFQEGVFDRIEIRSDGSIPNVEEQIINAQGVFKNQSVEGFVTQELDACLPTMRRHAFCATNTEYQYTDNGVLKNPVMKFGLYFNDSELPLQPSNAALAPLGPLEVPSGFRFSFQKPQASDLSGVIIYCQFPGQENFTLHSRILADDMQGFHSMTINSCDDQLVAGEDGSTYRVAVHSFDFGANENEEREASCGNLASFTFESSDGWEQVVAGMSGWGEVYDAWTTTNELWDSFSSCTPSGNAWMPPIEGLGITP